MMFTHLIHRLKSHSCDPYDRVLILEAAAALERPVDMVLHCPTCGLQHIDAPGLLENPPHPSGPHESCVGTWDNPPHRSHLCHGCGHIWRPADVATNGVERIETKGKDDSPIVTRRFHTVRDGRADDPGTWGISKTEDVQKLLDDPSVQKRVLHRLEFSPCVIGDDSCPKPTK